MGNSIVKKGLNKYKSLPVQVRASFWFLICSFLQKGISFLTTPIFTRLLSTAEYGQYTVFYSWLDFTSIFVSLRLYYGVFVQGLVKYEDDRSAFASSMQGLELTLCTAWTIVYLCAKDFWNDLLNLTTVQMLFMLILIWTAGAFRFWAAEKRNEFKYRALVILTIVTTVAKPVLGIIFVIKAEDKVTARIFAVVLVEVAAYVWLFFIQMIRGKTFFSAKYWKHSLAFAIPLIPHYVSQTVLSSADRIMIREMIGLSEAGIYGLAYAISNVMNIFNTALIQTMEPWIFHKIKANKASDIAKVAYPALIGVAAVNLLLIAFSPELVSIFAPKSYYNAIWIIPPVAMSVYFIFSYDLFASFQFYYEKKVFIMAGSIFGAVLNIILNYIFLQVFGYYAAAYTTFVCYLLYAVGHYLFMTKICKDYLEGIKVYDSKHVALISGTFILTDFIFLLTYKNAIIRYLIILAFVVLAVVFRERIIRSAKMIMAIRSRKQQDV